ncbi:hypothetical protein EVV80_28750, partial [Klebsiella pneumoniae]
MLADRNLRKGGGAILGAIGVAVIARPTSGLSAGGADRRVMLADRNLRKGGGAILGAIGVAVIARPTSGLSA